MGKSALNEPSVVTAQRYSDRFRAMLEITTGIFNKPLPLGWRRMSTEDGTIYCYNETTGQSMSGEPNCEYETCIEKYLADHSNYITKKDTLTPEVLAKLPECTKGSK